MNKSSLFKYSIIAFILLLSLSSFTNVEVKVFGKIYIKADGSIEGTNKIEQNGNTYKFTDNIEMKESIKIQTSNIIIDGAGYNLKVAGEELEPISGIEIIEQKNVTIKRLIINGFNNKNNVISINKANNITIENCTLTETNNGIDIDHSQNITIKQNKITEFKRTSIAIYNSTNFSIIDNYISRSIDFQYPQGLHISNSENSTISQNTISDCYYGIEIHACYGISFTRNHLTKNNIGLYLYYGGNNLITENTIIENERFGMELSSSSSNPGNTIHHNNFINNNMEYISEQLQVSNRWFAGPESNSWDSGEEGNYWSDYKMRYPDANEINGSGVYNIAFFINPENLDYYPLVNPITFPIPTPIPSPTPTLTPTSSPEPEPFPTIQVLVIIITILTGLGILIYSIKKRT